MPLLKSEIVSPAQLLLQYLLAVGQLHDENHPSHTRTNHVRTRSMITKRRKAIYSPEKAGRDPATQSMA